MKSLPFLELLERRTLLAAGHDDQSCALEALNLHISEGDECVIEQQASISENEAPTEMRTEAERSLLDWAAYTAGRLGVTAVSAALGLLEGGVVAVPSFVLIKGIEAVRGELPSPVKILVGLTTYPLSLQVMDQLLIEDEPSDPLFKLLYPVKWSVACSDSAIQWLEEIHSLEVETWAEALQPRSIKNFYWAAAATVFTGSTGGFDYPHLELPERAEHKSCPCEC